MQVNAQPFRLLVATSCLCTCALLPAQVPSVDRTLPLQLVQGQEFIYTGWFTEKNLHAGVHHEVTYKFETTFLVLETSIKKWDVAILTTLTQHSNSAQRPIEKKQVAPSSVRLEVAEIDRQGVLLSKPAPFAVPVNGPPTLEWGAFIESPRGRDRWESKEAGRPPRVWKLIGNEDVKGNACVKVVGVQQSDDWHSPRADHTAWQRRDTLWLLPQLGVAYRVERVIERREPARKEPTHQLILQYEMEGRPLSFRGQRFDDRVDEIGQVRKFAGEADALVRQPAQYKPQIEAALKRIAYHLERHPPTPYRKALGQVQKRLEAARRGEAPPEIAGDTNPNVSTAVSIGQRVPDFVTTEMFHGKSVRLEPLLGRPILLLFYKPHTETGVQTLRFAQLLRDHFRAGIHVLGMAVSDDTEFVRKQYVELCLTFPILNGKGLHQTFAVDATPRFVVIDGMGVLRGAYTGWGAHTPREVSEELKRWLPK